MKHLFTTTISAVFFICTLAFNSFSQVSETVNLATAGTLSSYSFTNSAETITDFTIIGNIDARDIKFMRDDMTVLANIDMSGASIVAYEGTEGTHGYATIYPANELPSEAFSKCSSLVSIEFPTNLNSIGSYAFFNCKNLYSIALPESITSIEAGVFVSCTSLSSIILPKSITSIEDSAFSACASLTSIELPANLNFIGDGVFSDCTSLTSITLPRSITSIGDGVFFGCSSLASISFPESITCIGARTFCGCSSLTSISLPKSITCIGIYAFRDCTSLTSIELPANLNTIEHYAFLYCDNLTEIINLNPNPIEIDEEVFQDFDKSTCTLRVRAESVELYRNAPIWQDFIIEGNASIGDVNTNISVSVYPNPVNDLLYIEPQNGIIPEIKLFSTEGKLLLQTKSNQIDMSDFASGMYIIQAEGKRVKVIKN